MDTAQKLAEESVALFYAKCAHILSPLTAVYMWEKTLHKEPEFPVLFKIPLHKKQAFEAWIEDVHPYEIPAILSFPASANQKFLEWMHS